MSDEPEWPEEMLLSSNHRHEILNYLCDDNDIDNAAPYVRRDVAADRIAALTAERDALALQVQRARDDALKEAANRLRMFGDLGGMDIVMSLRCATEGAGG
jgi:hypothetical protein